MRIPKSVFAEQFGCEQDRINFTDFTEISKFESEIFLVKNKVFTSQPGF